MAEQDVNWEARDVNALDKRYKKIFETGQEAMERKNWGYAIAMYRKVLRQHPGILSVRKSLREAQWQKCGAKASAMRQILTALMVIPQTGKVKTLILGGKFAEAMDVAEKAMSRDPTTRVCCMSLARAAESAELTDVAVYALEWAVAHHPKDQTLILWLANTYRSNKQGSQAVACYQKLIELSPNNESYKDGMRDASALASMEKGGWDKLAEGKGDFRSAAKDLKEAAVLEQADRVSKTEAGLEVLIENQLAEVAKRDTVDTRRKLADLYAEAGYYEEALASLARVIEIAGTTDPAVERLIADIKLKQIDQLIAPLKEQVAGGSLSADDAQAAAAQIAAYENDKTQLRLANLQDRVRHQPNSHEERFELAKALLGVGDVDHALPEFQFVQKSPRFRDEAMFYMAQCFLGKNVPDLAVEQLTSFLENHKQMDKLRKEALYLLGSCYHKAGNTDEARKLFKQIYSVDLKFRDVREIVENNHAPTA